MMHQIHTLTHTQKSEHSHHCKSPTLLKPLRVGEMVQGGTRLQPMGLAAVQDLMELGHGFPIDPARALGLKTCPL